MSQRVSPLDGGSEEWPARPRHTRSRSRGLDNHYPNHDTQRTARCPGHVDGRISRRPSHLRVDYAAHIRSASRVSWDGRVPLPSSPNHSSFSPSPPHSPVRRSNRPRPVSAVSLPDHSFGRPTVLTDRWSYDRERMPSPHSSRPGTPLSERGSMELAFSRPASTLAGSRPSSRPPSIFMDASTDLAYSHIPSATPSLKVIPQPPQPAPNPVRESQQQGPRPKSNRESYHLLTSEELEMLSHPPPLHPPMSASPALSPPLQIPPGASIPKLSNEITRLGPPKQKGQAHTTSDGTDDEREHKPGCMGLCEISTARCIGGKFGAWFMGMVIPITFGLVTGCIAAVAGCK